jgi:hypothetical protein
LVVEEDAMSRIMERVAGDKSVKVTLYSGADDPDLPGHVKQLPVGIRSRWVNQYNWAVMDTQDDEDAREQADSYTTVSVDDVAEILGSKSASGTAPTAITPVQPVPSATQPVQVGANKPLSMLDKILGKKQSVIQPGMFLLYKGKDGDLKTLLAYSNVFRDKDKEIFSTASHKEYAEAAEAGDALYPDLHLWHGGPDTKWGTIETVSFVDSFAVAGGTVLPGKEGVALRLKEMADKGELAVSFGYIGLRGPDGVYALYRPFEISPLPVGSESNPWTDLSFKENGMAFSDKKKGWLKENFGMNDEQIVAAEKSFEAMGVALKAAGVDYKEGAGETAPTPPDPAPVPPPPSPQPTPPAPSADATVMPQIEAIATAMKGLAEVVGGLVTEVKGLKEAAPAAAAAQADSQILARIAQGPGHSPASDPGNVEAGLKEQDDDWLGNIWKGAMPGFDQLLGGGGAVLTQAGTPGANGAGASGEVK